MTKTAIQWYLVIFKLLAGGGAGLLGFIGLAELVGAKKRTDLIAIIVALAMIIIGGGLAVLWIGTPSVIMAAAANISKGSPISLEFLACGLSVAVGVVYLFVERRENPVAGKVIGSAAILVALAVGYMTGYSHQAMLGTTAWHTPTIPLGFLLEALLLGGFCYLAIAPRLAPRLALRAKELPDDKSDDKLVNKLVDKCDDKKDTDKVFIWVLVVLAALAAVLALVHIFMVELGSDLVLYVLLVLVIGAAGPLLLALGVLTKLVKPAPLWALLGIVAALVGGLAFRAFVWVIVNPHLLSQIDGLLTVNSLHL